MPGRPLFKSLRGSGFKHGFSRMSPKQAVLDIGDWGSAIFKAAPHLTRIDQIEAGNATDIKMLAGKGGSLEKTPFKTSVEDFYLTNPIARASAVMAECSRLASGQMLTAAE